MKKYPISLIQRVALCRAHQGKCAYCSEPVTLRDLHVDHIIRESFLKTPDKLEQLLQELGLEGFDLNSYLNWLPTHSACNLKKGERDFTPNNIRYYLEMARAHYARVLEEEEKLRSEQKVDAALAKLGGLIESGRLSKREAFRFLAKAQAPSSQETREEPVVVCFGINVLDAEAGGLLPDDAPQDGPALYDWLESQLLERLNRETEWVWVRTESDRNGETISVRLAAWHIDLDRLPIQFEPGWELLEVRMFGELYDTDPSELFDCGIVQKYQATVNAPTTEENPFGLRVCPRCGFKNLKFRDVYDYEGDELYHFADCRQCGWSDWTQ